MQAGLGHLFGDQQSMNNINKHVKLSVPMIVRSLSLQIQFFFLLEKSLGVFKILLLVFQCLLLGTIAPDFLFPRKQFIILWAM